MVYSRVALYSVNGRIEPTLNTALEDVWLDVPTDLDKNLVAASPALHEAVYQPLPLGGGLASI